MVSRGGAKVSVLPRVNLLINSSRAPRFTAPTLRTSLRGSISLTPSVLPAPSQITVAPEVVAAPQIVAPHGNTLPHAARDGSLPFAAQASPTIATPSENTESGASETSLLGRLTRSIAKKLSFGRLFDAAPENSAPLAAMAGILPSDPLPLPEGVVLDEAPKAPDPRRSGGVRFNSFDVPTPRTSGGVFGDGPVVLQADARDDAAIETALRGLVDADVAKYGVSSSELKTVHVKRALGKSGQADTVFALFKQQKDGVEVHGSQLSFTVKILQDRAIVMGSMAKLYSSIDVETDSRFTDEELKARALERIGMPQEMGIDLEYVERKIIYSGGAWHTSNLYIAEDLPVMVAVDVATGEVFAWDARLGADQTQAAGRVEGRTVKQGVTQPDSEMKQVPLPYLTVTFSDGRTATTDSDGRFTSDSSGGKALDFVATLTGPYVSVNDRAGDPLRVSASLAPGDDRLVVFNPKGMTEEAIAQVNAFLQVNKVREWLKDRGLDDDRLNQLLRTHVNIDSECNAYYTPGRPSLNFFKGSARCANSAFDSVVYHEYGHFVDDMIGGIVNGGLSEGWGDIFSMFITGESRIGVGFIKGQEVSWIRDGNNDYQYKKYDEVHEQGTAWNGFAWDLRAMLINSMGEAAGAAMAEALIIPTMYAKASDIPSAIAQVLLNDLDTEGNLPHEEEIRRAAKNHGITLPENPGGLGGLIRRVAPTSFSRLSLGKASFDAPQRRSKPAVATPNAALTPSSAASRSTAVRAKIPFSAGLLIRGQVRREIKRFLDYHELKYTLKEYKGIFSSDFLLTVEGDRAVIELLMKNLEEWARRS